MHHDLLRDAEFWQFLLGIDQALAKDARKPGCPCGGRLHWANYPRNPRGGPENLPKECCYRLSLCCDRDGCRKRVTPPSTRFLGRKVYLLSVIFLAAVMRQQDDPVLRPPTHGPQGLRQGLSGSGIDLALVGTISKPSALVLPVAL